MKGEAWGEREGGVVGGGGAVPHTQRSVYMPGSKRNRVCTVTKGVPGSDLPKQRKKPKKSVVRPSRNCKKRDMPTSSLLKGFILDSKTGGSDVKASGRGEKGGRKGGKGAGRSGICFAKSKFSPPDLGTKIARRGWQREGKNPGRRGETDRKRPVGRLAGFKRDEKNWHRSGHASLCKRGECKGGYLETAV